MMSTPTSVNDAIFVRRQYVLTNFIIPWAIGLTKYRSPQDAVNRIQTANKRHSQYYAENLQKISEIGEEKVKELHLNTLYDNKNISNKLTTILKEYVFVPEDLMSGIFQVEIIKDFGLNAVIHGITKSKRIIIVNPSLVQMDHQSQQEREVILLSAMAVWKATEGNYYCEKSKELFTLKFNQELWNNYFSLLQQWAKSIKQFPSIDGTTKATNSSNQDTSPKQNNNSTNNQSQIRFRALPAWEFNKEQQIWKERSESSSNLNTTENEAMDIKNDDTKDAKNSELLRVITYNIWFQKNHQAIRTQALCELFKTSEAHVICLQEMTQDVLHNIGHHPYIRQHYILSDVSGSSFQQFGVVILVRKSNFYQLLKFTQYQLPTEMGRTLVIASIVCKPNEVLFVGTVHLESLSNAETRRKQLQLCSNIFRGKLRACKQYCSCLLVGDFNFDSTKNFKQIGKEPLENTINLNELGSEWIDLWPEIKGKEDKGYTFDTVTNTMRFKQKYDQARYDRIMIWNNFSLLQAPQIKILGNVKIQQNLYNNDVFISDHYGLGAQFEISHTSNIRDTISNS